MLVMIWSVNLADWWVVRVCLATSCSRFKESRISLYFLVSDFSGRRRSTSISPDRINLPSHSIERSLSLPLKLSSQVEYDSIASDR